MATLNQEAQDVVLVFAGYRSTFTWTQQQTPDVIGLFDSVVQTTRGPLEAGIAAVDTEKAVKGLMAWLDSDSLDWDAVERGDAWDD